MTMNQHKLSLYMLSTKGCFGHADEVKKSTPLQLLMIAKNDWLAAFYKESTYVVDQMLFRS